MANSSLNDGKLDRRLQVFSVSLLHQTWASTFLAGVIAARVVRRGRDRTDGRPVRAAWRGPHPGQALVGPVREAARG